MKRFVNGLAATLFAVTMLFSLTPAASAEKSAMCGNVSVSFGKTDFAPGEEVFSTATVSSCTSGNTPMAVEQVLTDACGNSTVLSTTTFKLRKGETRQTMVTFLAPAPSDCGPGFTVSARLTNQAGGVIGMSSTAFNVVNPAP